MGNIKSDLNKDVRGKSIKYLLITLFFIMLPSFINIAICVMTWRKIDFSANFKNGAYFMYSISLLAPIWYTIETTFDDSGRKGREGIPVTEALVTIIVAVVCYSVLCIFDEYIGISNPWPPALISILLLAWSIHLAYKIHIKDLSVEEPNMVRMVDESKMKKKIEDAENGIIGENQRKGVEGQLESSVTDFDEEDCND